MLSYDILIVGGGPSGSSCAWGLRRSGLEVAILDKQVFPRDKVCGGWITPRVLSLLEIDPVEYACRRILQPIRGFKIGCIGTSIRQEADYGKRVSYGIVRRQFDDYLIKRCEAHLHEGVGLLDLQRVAGGWIVNGKIRTRLLVGAGGHFCPVARHLGMRRAENAVVAQETEFELDAQQWTDCPVRGATPELYFCADMRGYGWCFRKGNLLNIGLGRADPHGLPEHAHTFLRFLTARDGLSQKIPAFRGHAYLLYGTSSRPIAGDGFLLVGDAAGLASPQSGEGILPAVESGLLAAEVILSANGSYGGAQLEPYARRIEERFNGVNREWAPRVGRYLPDNWLRFAATRLLGSSWFIRNVVLDRWFLHL